MVSQDRDPYLNFLGNHITKVPVSSHYRWLYRENPHGKALTWLAIHRKSNDIIGCTSIFPKKLWVRDNIILGSVGGDTFVDTRFRRKGIAKELHRVSLRKMVEAGIKLQYGFPNQANFGAFLKAGSFHPGNFREMRVILTSQPIIEKLHLGETVSFRLSGLADRILSFFIKSRLSKSRNPETNLKEILKFDARFDRLMEEVIPSFNICGVRDRNALNWRYFKNPLKTHTILSYEEQGDIHGFSILEFCGNRCHLFDFFVRNEDEMIENFICAVIKFAISKNSDLITSLINPVGPYIKNFLRFGFTIGYRSTKTPFHVLVPNEDKDLEYLTNIKNWYLTNGDCDLEAMGPGWD